MTASTTPGMSDDNGGGRPYRVGLIGTGIMGTNHGIGYMLNPRTEIVAVADSDLQNLERFSRRFGITSHLLDIRGDVLAGESRYRRAHSAREAEPRCRDRGGASGYPRHLLREADLRQPGRGRPDGRRDIVAGRPLGGGGTRCATCRSSGRSRRCPTPASWGRSGR